MGCHAVKLVLVNHLDTVHLAFLHDFPQDVARLVVVHVNLGTARIEEQLMVSPVGGRVHHAQAPSFPREIFRIRFRTTAQFIILTVSQGNFLTLVGHNQTRG